jgi:hypothetical protein
VGKEYVISGNDALMKCSVPSHVADFITVVSWIDSEGTQITADSRLTNGTVFLLCADVGLRSAIG